MGYKAEQSWVDKDGFSASGCTSESNSFMVHPYMISRPTGYIRLPEALGTFLSFVISKTNLFPAVGVLLHPDAEVPVGVLGYNFQIPGRRHRGSNGNTVVLFDGDKLCGHHHMPLRSQFPEQGLPWKQQCSSKAVTAFFYGILKSLVNST